MFPPSITVLFSIFFLLNSTIGCYLLFEIFVVFGYHLKQSGISVKLFFVFVHNPDNGHFHSFNYGVILLGRFVKKGSEYFFFGILKPAPVRGLLYVGIFGAAVRSFFCRFPYKSDLLFSENLPALLLCSPVYRSSFLLPIFWEFRELSFWLVSFSLLYYIWWFCEKHTREVRCFVNVNTANKIADTQENIANKMTIKERILYFLKNKGASFESVFKKIGVTSSNFRGYAKRTPIKPTSIVNLFTEFSDLNLEW